MPYLMPPPSSLVQLTLDVSSPTSHLPAVDYWRFWSESGWAKSTNGYVGHLCSCKPGCFSFPGWSGNETEPGLVTVYFQPSSSPCWCLMTSATSQQSRKQSCRTSMTSVNTLHSLSFILSSLPCAGRWLLWIRINLVSRVDSWAAAL